MAEPPRDFQSGRPLRDELTAARLNQILAAIRRSRPLAGRGIGVYETGAGTRIDLLTSGGRRGTKVSTPFTVELQKDPMTGGMKAGVVYDSKLFASLRPSDLVPITGLLTSATPEKEDAGWFLLEDPEDLIWLELTFDEEGGLDQAHIRHLGTGAFDPALAGGNAESYYETENNALGLPVQTVARKLIASYANGELTQWTDRHQVLTDTIVNGYAIRYPFDHSGGYVAPEE